jgi:quercetin dioxygenase-like cupin family protein
MDDQELNRLLREWKAPDAPPHLRPRAHRSWLRWLVTGAIPVPVPAAIAALLLVGWIGAPLAERLSAPEPSTPRRTGELARYALTGPLEGYDAVVAELNFGPGASAQEHRHPGAVVGYVIDGQMRTAVNREADQIVPAGGTFFEPAGILHSTFGSASPDDPVRIVAFMVVPTGSPLTARSTPQP